MSDESPIVSHVASPEYRNSVDRMTCAVPGCKRWKVGDGSEFCKDHEGGCLMNPPTKRRYHAGSLCVPTPGRFRKAKS